MIESRDFIGLIEDALISIADMAEIEDALASLLQHTQQALDTSVAYILVDDAERLTLQRSIGVTARATWIQRRDSLEGRVMRAGEPLVVDDASGRTPFLEGVLSPATLLAVPMILRRQPVGVVAVARPGRRFTIDEQRWLSALAQVAAITIENARLLARERRRVERAEIISSLSAIERTDPVAFCQQMAREVVHLLDVDTTDVLLLDDSKRELVRLGTGDSAPGTFGAGVSRIRLSDAGPLQHAFLTGRSYSWQDQKSRDQGAPEIAALGMRAVFAVPIPGDDLPRGLLVVARRRPRPFEEEDDAFLRLVGARIGLLLHQADVERARAHAVARQEFLAVVSHELKTPLAVIRAYSEALERRLQRPASADDLAENLRVLGRVQEQAGHALGMIDQMLDLQRLEAGLIVIEPGRFDLSAMAKRLVDELQPTALNHRLSVTAHAPVHVVADRRRIEQVLVNLIDNAIKYSPNGGDVVIGVESLEIAGRPLARVSVVDQGIGIAPADLGRIFDRFYQGRSHTFRGRGGLGIGLFIAHQIVERHGGHLSVRSDLGKGSTFSFTLARPSPRTAE
jgi:signal transduction histidine kinase